MYLTSHCQLEGAATLGAHKNMFLLVVTVSVANLFFNAGVVCMPLSEQGPHIDHGWDQVVRLRHLYAARPGLHLLISEDGQIHGSEAQTLHSKSSTLKPNKQWWKKYSDQLL